MSRIETIAQLLREGSTVHVDKLLTVRQNKNGSTYRLKRWRGKQIACFGIRNDGRREDMTRVDFLNLKYWGRHVLEPKSAL